MANFTPTPARWIEPKRQTRGEAFQENLIWTIVSLFLVFAFERFLDFIFNPFGKEEAVEEKIAEKLYARQRARETRERAFAENPDDPLNQYYRRIDSKNDPDDAIYKKWFEDWIAGKVIDSDLRWAPSIKDGITPNFLKYLKRQLELHSKAPLLKRILFLNTLHRFYPEFSASLSTLGGDIARYEAQMSRDTDESKLISEIKKFGLSDGLADYLIEEDLSTRDFKRAVTFLKQCQDAGYNADTSICLYENRIVIGSDTAKIIHKLTSEYALPSRVGYAYVNGQITIAQLREMCEYLQAGQEIYGSGFYQVAPNKTKTMYDDLVDEYLKQYREKNLVAQKST